jgi:type 1 fimbria pilin
MSVITRTVRLGLLFSALTPPAFGYDVLVSVTGNLIGNTCVVAADSQEQSVPLGTISLRQFPKAGAVSNIKQPFQLRLEECGPTFAGVKIRFSGTPDTLNPQLVKVDDGGATGIAVQILDKDGVLIPLGDQTDAYGTTGDESVEMTFYARLAANGATVTGGDVSAIATWTTEYQ